MILGERDGRRYPTAEEVELIASLVTRQGVTLGQIYTATKEVMHHGVRRDRAEIALRTLMRQGRVYFVQRGEDRRWYPVRRMQT